MVLRPKEERMTSPAQDRPDLQDQVERQLSREFQSLPRDRVRQVAHESVEAFRGARVTQFVPLLAFREARRRVLREGTPATST
jgi:hypothetical protein